MNTINTSDASIDTAREEFQTLSSMRSEELLLNRIQALGPEYAQSYIMQYWYKYDGARIAYLKWRDIADEFGMSPEKIERALKQIPELKRCADAIDALLKAGYSEGYPNPENEKFYDPFRADHLSELRDAHGFVPECFAFTPQGSTDPKSTILVVAKVHDGRYFNFLDYARGVQAALTAEVKKRGFTHPSIDVDYSLKEDSVILGADYVIPGRPDAPSLITWARIIADIPGSKRVSKNLFTFDLNLLIGTESDSTYPKTASLILHSGTSAIRPKEFETAACTYINQRIKDLNLSVDSVYLSSERGPLGPNYLDLHYGYYCQCEELEDVQRQLALIPELIKSGAREYFLVCSDVPELSQFGEKKIVVKLSEIVEGSWS